MLASLWTPAYIGIGSNLGDPEHQVRAAIAALAQLDGLRVIAQSHLYRTRAWGRTDQPDFVNAVVGGLSLLSSAELLEKMFALELAAGRPAEREKWSERILDLDLLLFGTERVAEPARQLPHPGIAQRAFVLAPLREIAPSLQVPGAGRVEVLAERVGLEGIEVLN